MSRAEAAVQRQLDAYDAHDLERFVAEYTDDVRVFRLPAPSRSSPGKPAFASTRRRTGSTCLAACLVVNRMVSGNIVVDHEAITGLPGGPSSAVAVYDVVDGRSGRVRTRPATRTRSGSTFGAARSPASPPRAPGPGRPAADGSVDPAPVRSRRFELFFARNQRRGEIEAHFRASRGWLSSPARAQNCIDDSLDPCMVITIRHASASDRSAMHALQMRAFEEEGRGGAGTRDIPPLQEDLQPAATVRGARAIPGSIGGDAVTRAAPGRSSGFQGAAHR